MRIRWQPAGSDWTLRLRLDPDESLAGTGQGRAAIQLVTNSCTVRLPGPIGEPHPDLLAAAALLVTWPWVGRQFVVDRPVSAAFAAVLADTFTIEVRPVDDRLPTRTPGDRVGVSYSSGVDSIALTELVGPAAPLIHFQRVSHPRVPDRATHIRSDQLALLARRAGERGREVWVVESDLEFLCLPWPQFPTWPAVAVGAVLLADELRLAALGFGSVLESVYLRGGRAYRGPGAGPWAAVLSAVGLPLCRPTAGLTEVGTLLLTRGGELAGLAQSCLLGMAGRPCQGCVKCVRKELLTAALERRPVAPEIRRRLTPGDPAAKDFEGPPPLHMQNITEYVVARVPGLAGTVVGALATRMSVSESATAWNERFYPPALADEVPQRWRAECTRRLRGRIEPMAAPEIRTVETFDGAQRLR
ncbi:hypothetical protein JQS43_01830 [Natronosporangium hydrolyticum]|uniref:Uncharacterized protein n=1 Tax=Natronosporangium hydrolyticum TaxID=2811111 RepID=A0A895YHY7_9ACTN|nr:DUF6395 domain-containing protein [Natronosporangium hydrolyticum]QSB15139.1 hypothetical protein JQS43_01830 [Natronosporangium hydrolyticum]